MKSTAAICQKLNSEAQSYGDFAQNISQLSQSIWTLITTEAEDGSSQFSPICQLLDEISQCNMSIGLAIRRSIEDLNDILERDKVLQRKIKEHSQIIHNYEKVKQNLAQSKANLQLIENDPKFLSKKLSLEKEISKLQSELKIKTEEARDATMNLIEEKKKISAFNIRRIRFAFQRIGTSLKSNYDISVTLFNRFKEGIEEIQKGNDLSTFVLYGQNEAPELPSDMKTLKYIAGVTTTVVNDDDNEYVLCDKEEKPRKSNQHTNNSEHQNSESHLQSNHENSNHEINTTQENQNTDANHLTISTENNQNLIEKEDDKTEENGNLIEKEKNDVQNENETEQAINNDSTVNETQESTTNGQSVNTENEANPQPADDFE